MNWLAHLYLSEPNPAARIGNLLPDLVRAGELASLPAEFQRGIKQHRAIDAFTDAHAAVRQSKVRVGPSFRRYSGILIDLFYDHFLARNWSSYSHEPLTNFTENFYASVDECREQLPPFVSARFEQMRAGDLLASYRDFSGITRALARLSLRFGRPIDLSPCVQILEQSYDLFSADFQAFFPQLQSHVAQLHKANG